MSESYPSEATAPTPEVQNTNPYGAPPPPPPPPMVGYEAPVAHAYGAPISQVPGKIRGTGLCILLMVVTFGIYTLVWYYQTHDEMKRHTNNGLGGGLALVLAFFVGFVMPYITSSEVGTMYERAGQPKPVSGATGLWYFPGMLILIGPLVWFIKTNGALNAYWRSQGIR